MHRLRGSRGFTLIELLIVVAIVGILAALAMAGYRQARLRGAEAAAIVALEAINRAQLSFALTCGHQRYAPSLSSLGIPAPRTGDAFLSPDMTAADEIVKSGYRFTMSGTELPPELEERPTCNGVRPVAGYQAIADPIQPGLTGIRFFGTNTSRVVFASDRSFEGEMPEAGDPPHGAEIR